MLTAALPRENGAVRVLGLPLLAQALAHSQDTSAAGLAQAALRAAVVFQTTLELERLLELFARELAAVVAYDLVVYVNEEVDLVWRRGEEATHRLSYRLLLEDRNLGEALIARRHPFTRRARSCSGNICSVPWSIRFATLSTFAGRERTPAAIP